MSLYPVLTEQERNAKYLLKDLHYSDPSSAVLSFWNGDDDAFKIITQPKHRVNWFLVSEDEKPENSKLISLVRIPGKAPLLQKYADCTEIEGLQLLKFIYDDYKIGCRLAHQPIVQQDNSMMASINDRICDYKASGGLPNIICTNKLVLPRKDLSKAVDHNTAWIQDQYRGYFMTFTPDKWGREAPFTLADREFLDEHDTLEFPTQFMGFERSGEEGRYYDLIAIKPMSTESIAHYKDYNLLCHDMNLLTASYLDPAPNQPNVRQLWTQNIKDWSSQNSIQYAVASEIMSKAAKLMVKPSSLQIDGCNYTNDASLLLQRCILGN